VSRVTSASLSSVAALTLERVCKRYDEVTVLGPVDLVVPAGQTVALVGPSGAGKTTLLRIAAGLVLPSEGTVEVHGHAIGRLPPGRERAELVGVVAQQFDLVPHLSALHNVLAGRLGSWSVWKTLVSLVVPPERHLAMVALQRVGVADRARLRAGRLSGGEQQRVAIARVLVQDPAVLLADEPVASLDPARAREITELLVGIARQSGKTLVASIHAVELARAHFDRVVGLRNGLIQFDQPTTLVTDAMLAELYELQGLRSAV
jgi:phosphonate transport system ATP-binding protein